MSLSHSDSPTKQDLMDPLDRALDHSPLEEPSPWFTTQTISYIRRESASQQKRFFVQIWSTIAALALLTFFLGIEIRDQSLFQADFLTMLNEDGSDPSIEGLW